MLKIEHFIVSSLNLGPICEKRAFCLLNAAFAVATVEFQVYILHHLYNIKIRKLK